MKAEAIVRICSQILQNKETPNIPVERLFHLKSLINFYDLILSYKDQIGLSTEKQGKYLVKLIETIDETCKPLIANAPIVQTSIDLEQTSKQASYTHQNVKHAHNMLSMLYYEKILYDLYVPYNRHAIFSFIGDQGLINPVEGDIKHKHTTDQLEDIKAVFDNDMGLGLLFYSCFERHYIENIEDPNLSYYQYSIRLDNLNIEQRGYLYKKLTEIYQTAGPEREVIHLYLKTLEILSLADTQAQFRELEIKIAQTFCKIAPNKTTLKESFPMNLSFVSSMFGLEVFFPSIIKNRESIPGDTSKIDQNSNHYAEFYTKAESYLETYRSTFKTRQKIYQIAHAILFDDKKKPKNQTRIEKMETTKLRCIPYHEEPKKFPELSEFFGIPSEEKEIEKPVIDIPPIESSPKSAKVISVTSHPLPDLKSVETVAPIKRPSVKKEESVPTSAIPIPSQKSEYDFTYSQRVIAQFEQDRENSFISHSVPFAVDPYAFTYGIETTRENQTHHGYIDRHWTVPVEIIQNGNTRRCKMTIAVGGKDNMVYHRSLEKKMAQEFLAEFFQEGDNLADFPPLVLEDKKQKQPRSEMRGTTVVKQTNFYTKEIIDPDFGIVRIFDYKTLKALHNKGALQTS